MKTKQNSKLFAKIFTGKTQKEQEVIGKVLLEIINEELRDYILEQKIVGGILHK